jgi:hypothetical protein
MVLECGRFAIYRAHVVAEVAVDAHDVFILVKASELFFGTRTPPIKRLSLFNIVGLVCRTSNCTEGSDDNDWAALIKIEAGVEY